MTRRSLGGLRRTSFSRDRPQKRRRNIHVVLGSDSTRMARDIATHDRGHGDAARTTVTFVFRDQRFFLLF